MKRKPKGSNFIIPLVVYPFDIMVSIAQDDTTFRTALEKHLPPNCRKDIEDDPDILMMGSTTNGRTLNLQTGFQTVIRLKDYPAGPRGHAIVAHEIFHACTFVLWRVGLPLEVMKTDEAYAYLIDYVTEQFYNNLGNL